MVAEGVTHLALGTSNHKISLSPDQIMLHEQLNHIVSKNRYWIN